MMSDDEIIAVVQAHKEGKQIEWTPRKSFGSSWYRFDRPEHDDWNFTINKYRVAQEPRKPREWLITPTGQSFECKPMQVLPYGYRYEDCIRVREVIE